MGLVLEELEVVLSLTRTGARVMEVVGSHKHSGNFFREAQHRVSTAPCWTFLPLPISLCFSDLRVSVELTEEGLLLNSTSPSGFLRRLGL